MGIGSGAYNFVLVLHILAVIVGLGSVTLNGVYAMEAKRRQGPEALAISEANAKATKIAEYVIFTIPLWGFGLIGLSDGVWELSQTWLWLSLVLYVIAVGLSQAVLLPIDRKMHALQSELVAAPSTGAAGPPPQVAQLDALGKRAGAVAGILNLLLIVILVLMVWKPGA